MKIYYIVILISVLLLSYATYYIYDLDTVLYLTREDGFFENLSSLCFFISSIIFLISFLISKEGNDLFCFKTKKNIFLILLFLVFLFGAGEEISWGQRIFDYKTPKVLTEENVQGEFNIHNLKIFYSKEYQPGSILQFNRIFDLFWISFCVLIPLLNKYSLVVSTFIKKINLPIVPIGIGLLFIFNLFLSQILKHLTTIEIYSELAEIKEYNFSILFLAVSMFILVQIYQKHHFTEGSSTFSVDLINKDLNQ